MTNRLYYLLIFIVLTSCSRFRIDQDIVNYFMSELFIDKDIVESEFQSSAFFKDSFKNDLNKYLKQITHDEHLDIELPLAPTGKPIEYKEINSETLYVRIENLLFDTSKLDHTLSVLDNRKHIIFDLRGNRGGKIVNVNNIFNRIDNNAYQLQYNVMFPNFKTAFHRMDTRTFEQYEYKNIKFVDAKDCPAFDCKVNWADESYIADSSISAPRSKVNLHIIYDESCTSACEVFLIYANSFKNCTTYSTGPSKGSYLYGGILTVKLPQSGINISIPRVRRYYSHENYKKGNGISPDITLASDFLLDNFIRKYIINRHN